MARIVLLRTKSTKKSPIKRAHTKSQTDRESSKGYLIDILVKLPAELIDESGKRVKSSNLVLSKRARAKHILRDTYGMSDKDIETMVESRTKKYQRIEGIKEYYRGTASAEEISSKHKMIPETVHAAARHIYKFEIPQRGQVPLSVNNTLIHRYYKMRAGFLAGEIPEAVFEGYLLDTAYDRPEFAANIAHILFTTDDNAIKLIGKRGKALRNKMENIITERRIALNKRHPIVPVSYPKKGFDELANEKMKRDDDRMQRNMVDAEESTITRKYPTSAIDDIDEIIDRQNIEKRGRSYDAGLPFNEVIFLDKPKFRRHKKSKITIRKKPMNVKKPVKKCRCK